MRNFFKKILPPIIIDFYREIYIKNLIRKNRKQVKENEQDVNIYETDLTAEKLNEWGKNTTWNEIQMFFISKKGNILDVACGTGINMKDVQKFSPDANIYGCDISQNLINICLKSGIDNDKLICSDALKIDFPENFFNYSYSIGSLEHFTEKGLDKIIDKLHFITKEYTVHMMPVSKNNNNEGWIKTYQTFHNNSVEWWVNKFEKKFSKVQVINSSWKDHISIGKWFICYK